MRRLSFVAKATLVASVLYLVLGLAVQVARAGEVAPPYGGPCLSDGFPTVHDRVLRRAWNRHAGAEHANRVCRFIAQIRLESSGRADAKSAAGAEGLGQQIKSAAQDCRERGGLKGSRRDARFSAGCAAWLMAKHMKGQREQRSEICRQRNAELGYVSGPGHVWGGQKAARKELGLIARCPEDGILDGMRLILRPEAYKEAANYPRAIDKLERRAVPR